MSPILNEGDFVATTCWWPKLQLGRLVVVRHPRYKIIVKRITEFREDGHFLLSGENDASVESQQIGWISKDDLLGVVLFSIKNNRCYG